MPVKKKSKRVQSIKRNVVHGTGHRSTDHCHQRASIEAQIAALENQLAMLDRASDSGLRTSGPASNSNPEARSLKPEARATLAAPANLLAVPVGSSFLRVSWNAVVGAKGYLLQYSSDANFVNDTHAIILDAPGTAMTLSGLKPDTMYHVKVKSLADIGDSDSNFSMAYLVRTGKATGDETVTFLQGWLADLQNVNQNALALLPEIENGTLSPAERRRLLGSGVRRYGYFDKVSDVATDYPQFWSLGENETETMKALIREIEVLRNLLVSFEFGSRLVTDRLLTVGHEVFRLANVYYRGVREAMRRQMPEAEQVFQLLQLFWQRPRRTSGGTTRKQALRDARALERGTRVGKVTFENEADTFTKGKRTITDETMPMPKGGVKMETVDSGQ